MRCGAVTLGGHLAILESTSCITWRRYIRRSARLRATGARLLATAADQQLTPASPRAGRRFRCRPARLYQAPGKCPAICRPPFGHWQRLVWRGRLAVRDPRELGVPVHGQVDDLARCRPREPAQRRPFILGTEPEVQHHAGSQAQRLEATQMSRRSSTSRLPSASDSPNRGIIHASGLSRSARFSGASGLRFQDLQKFGFAEAMCYAVAGPGWMPRCLNRVAMSVRRCS